MKATKHYFPVVLFIMLNKVVLTFESVRDEILKWDHSNESYQAGLSYHGVLFFNIYKFNFSLFCTWVEFSWNWKGYM